MADSVPAGLRYRVCERCKEKKDAGAKQLKSPREPSVLPLPGSPKQVKAALSEGHIVHTLEVKETAESAQDDGNVEKKEETEIGEAPLNASTLTPTPHSSVGVKTEESTIQEPNVTGLHCTRCPCSYHAACALESGSGSSSSSSEGREGWTCFKCR